MTDTKPLGTSHIRGDTPLVKKARVIFIAPKNQSTEIRGTVKKQKTQMTKNMQSFIDLREWWFKSGPLEEPIPTKKGVMVHREHIMKLSIALISEMNHDEVMAEQLDQLRTQIARLEGKVD